MTLSLAVLLRLNEKKPTDTAGICLIGRALTVVRKIEQKKIVDCVNQVLMMF